MPILEIIWSWIVCKILDKIFSKKGENEKIIQKYQQHIFELQNKKDAAEAEALNEKFKVLKITDSLKRTGVSVEKLIDRYNKPLNAILISYASQGIKSENGKFRKLAFVKQELLRYNAKYLGGTTSLIPPSKVPPNIKIVKDLQEWFEKEILKNRYCKLRYLALIDLKNVFWRKYLPYKQKAPLHFTIGEVLNIDDIFTEDQINKISLAQIIRDGDIVWLASRALSEAELDIIIKNRRIIEEKLGNLSLREFADDNKIESISKILSEFIGMPNEIAKSIVNEAKFWESQFR